MCDSVDGFSMPYYCSGVAKQIGSNYVVVLRGIRNDTLFDLALILRDCEVGQVITMPKSTFYMSDDTRITEYELGHISLNVEPDPNETCIMIFMERIEPFKADTLDCKFDYSMANLVSLDTIRICR